MKESVGAGQFLYVKHALQYVNVHVVSSRHPQGYQEGTFEDFCQNVKSGPAH